MLERALLQQATENNVIENAYRWGIEVWSLEKALKLVEQLKASVQLKKSITGRQKSDSRKFVKDISGPFVKIEAFSRHYRPVYKVLSSWPKLRLDCPVGASPFDPVWRSPPGDTGRPRHEAKLRGSWAKRRMTRRAKPRFQGGGAGFCELCQVAYTNFDKHLVSDGHMKLAQDDRNYMSLDNLIRQRHSLAPLVTVNGTSDICVSGCPTRRSPRSNKPYRAISLDAEPSRRPSPLRLSVDDHTSKRNDMRLEPNCLMSRRSTTSREEAQVNGIATDDPPPRTRRLRHSVSVSPEGNAAMSVKNDSMDSTACDRARIAKAYETKEQQQCELIKRKRLSAEEKLLEDNRQYYKVEVLSCKLRSTGVIIGQKRVEDHAEESSVPILEEVGPVRLNGDMVSVESMDNERRTKKSRRSLLSLLNDEAENFLFGKKDENYAPGTGESGGRNSPRCEAPESTSSLGTEPARNHSSTKVKQESADVTCENGQCERASTGTPAESEFEQGQGCKKRRRTHAELFIHDNLDYYKFEISESRLRAHGVGKLDGEPRDKSFTEDKDDDSNVVLDLEDESRIENDVQLACSPCIEELHFSFENVPYSEPWFSTFERQDRGDTLDMYYSDPLADKPFLLPYEMPMDKIVSHVESLQTPQVVRRKKRRRKHMVGKLPRKSPRCHASTLAMLSGLISKRRSRLQPTSLLPQPPAAVEEADKEKLEKADKEEKVIVKSGGSDEQKDQTTGEGNRTNLVCKVQNKVSDDLIARAVQLEQLLTSCEEDNEETSSANKSSAKNGRRKSRGRSVSDGHLDFGVDPSFTVENSEELLRWSEPFVSCTTDLNALLDGETQCGCWSHISNDPGDLSSDCASTSDTISDSGLRKRHLKNGKKRKRNLTGWPRDKPRKKYRVVTTDGDKLSILSIKSKKFSGVKRVDKDAESDISSEPQTEASTSLRSESVRRLLPVVSLKREKSIGLRRVDKDEASDISEPRTEASASVKIECTRRLRPPKCKKTTYLCLRKRR